MYNYLLSYPSPIISLSIRIWRNNIIFVVNSGLTFSGFMIFQYRYCFCAHLPFEFADLNQWPYSWSNCEWVSTFCFSRIDHFLAYFFTLCNSRYFQFLNCVMEFWTFFKDFMKVLIVYQVQMSYNEVASRTLFEWRILVRATRRINIEVIDAAVQ